MEHYIATYDHAEEIRKVYDELRLIGACHKVSYPTIKKWFLDKYPQIAEFGVEKDQEEEPVMEVVAGAAERPSVAQLKAS